MKAFDEYKVDEAFPARSMYASRDDYAAACRAWDAKRYAVYAEFKADVLAELGISGHPKADKLYAMAWDRGHSEGYSAVFDRAEELSELIR